MTNPSIRRFQCDLGLILAAFVASAFAGVCRAGEEPLLAVGEHDELPSLGNIDAYAVNARTNREAAEATDNTRNTTPTTTAAIWTGEARTT